MITPTLLIVDSDAAVRDIIQDYFVARGWAVLVAGSTAEGLMRLDPLPDCVIVDLMDPGRGGELLLWKVRSEKLPIRVVITTAPGDSERSRAVLTLRPDALLEKPVDLDALYSACRGESHPSVGRACGTDNHPFGDG